MKKSPLRKTLALLAAFSAAGVFVGCATAAPEGNPKIMPKQEQAPRTPESAVTPAIKGQNRHEEFLARLKEGPIDLLFVGDSITDFWPRRGEYTWLQFARYNPANFGISGDRTENVLWRMLNGELEGISPKLVVMMIGTNNVGQCPDEKPEWAAEGVKKLVETLRQKLPNSKLLLLAVFPRGSKDSVLRQKVAAINKALPALADGRQVVYLDIGDKFLGADGEIPADVMPDKLHPSPKGYGIWYAAVAPTIAELMK